MQDDDNISQSDIMKSSENGRHILTVVNATRDDSKVYTCTAVNNVGVATLDITVIVNCK